MLALYRCGRQAEALGRTATRRRALVDELGIEPGKRLQELEQAILRQDASLDLAPAPAATRRGPDAGPPGSSSAATASSRSFPPRCEDAAAGRGRLFLISGESGVGKTRLADELASRAKDVGRAHALGTLLEARVALPRTGRGRRR